MQHSSAECYLSGIEPGPFPRRVRRENKERTLISSKLESLSEKSHKQDKGAVGATLELGQTRRGGGLEVTLLSAEGPGTSLRSALKPPHH